MAQDIQTSFIPKKPIEETGPKRRTSGTGVITLIAFIVFILSLAATGGSFLYERFLVNAIEQKGQDLERARAQFEPETIEELSRMDEKLQEGQRILSNHTALSSLFDLLEELTLKSVRFTSLSLEQGVGGTTVSLAGVAQSFGSVALQSDVFGENRHIRDTIFSEVNVNTVGSVSFNVSFTLEPGYFTYEADLARNQ